MKREWSSGSVCGFVLVAAFCLVHACAFATVYVDLNAPVGTNDGSSWANACLTVQAGLDASSSGEEIWVADGTYAEAIVLGDGDVLYGGFEGHGGAEETSLSQRAWETNVTAIDASSIAAPNHVVTMDTVTGTRVDGFILTGGQATAASGPSAMGGGVYCVNADAANEIIHCIISGNTATNGGGILLDSADPGIANCLISGNRASTNGGGLNAYNDTMAEVFNCTVSGNTAGDYGGGAYVYLNAQPVFRNVVFENNTSFAVYEDFDSGDPYVEFCLFANNPDGAYRDFGGSTYADDEVEVMDYTLWQAYENLTGDPAFVMAGPDAVSGTWTGVTPGVGQTVLTDSTAAFMPGALVGLLINADTGQRGQALIIANDATSVTVQGDATGYAGIGDAYVVVDYHLEWTSAAIDAGTSVGAPADDLDGLPRPSLAAHDIGAYEAQCGAAGPQDIEVSPTSLGFGDWPDGAGASPAQEVVMVNLGGTELAIASVALTGTDVGDFAIASDTGESPLLACNLRRVEVRFNPASAGPKSAALTITSDDPDEQTVDISLSGTGTALSVVRVDQDAPGPIHDGSSWQNACLTIQDGIDASSAGADIWVADGTYLEAIVVGHGDVLYGGFEGYDGAEETDRTQRDWEANETVIDASTADGGGPANHVVTMGGVTSARLDGFTVTGGHADGSGVPDDSGASVFLLLADHTNTIAHCVVRDNSADFGVDHAVLHRREHVRCHRWREHQGHILRDRQLHHQWQLRHRNVRRTGLVLAEYARNHRGELHHKR